MPFQKWYLERNKAIQSLEPKIIEEKSIFSKVKPGRRAVMPYLLRLKSFSVRPKFWNT